MAKTLASQAKNGGSIPPARSLSNGRNAAKPDPHEAIVIRVPGLRE
jgi:hypothetical protein